MTPEEEKQKKQREAAFALAQETVQSGGHTSALPSSGPAEQKERREPGASSVARTAPKTPQSTATGNPAPSQDDDDDYEDDVGDKIKRALDPGGLFSDPIKLKAKTGALDPAQANLEKLRQQFGEITDKATAGTVKGIDPAMMQRGDIRSVNTTEIGKPTAVSAQDVAARDIAARDVTAGAVSARDINAVAPITARNVTGVAAAPVGSVVAGPRASTIGDVGSVKTSDVLAAGGDVATAQSLALQAAQGQAPSVAELQQARAQDALLKQQAAAMAGRGYDPAAVRNIQNQAAAAGQELAQRQAEVRAGEMATARQQAASVSLENRAQIMQASQQDVANRLQAMSADQQASVSQRAQDLQASGMNQETALRTALADQDAAMRAQLANQSAALAAGTTTAQLELERQRANQAAQLAAGTTTAQLGLEAARANQAASLQASQANQAASLEAARANAQLNMEASKANQGAELQAMMANADNSLRAQLANQGVDLEVVRQNAQAGNTAAIANMEAALQQMGMNQDMVKAYMQSMVGIEQTQADLAKSKAALETQAATTQAQMKQQHNAGILGGIGSAVGSIFSDPKTKKNMKQANTPDVEKFLNALAPYVFEYKSGGGKHLGVNADEVAASEYGDQLVKSENGLKKIDVSQAFGGLLAAAINSNNRLKKLEKK